MKWKFIVQNNGQCLKWKIERWKGHVLYLYTWLLGNLGISISALASVLVSAPISAFKFKDCVLHSITQFHIYFCQTSFSINLQLIDWRQSSQKIRDKDTLQKIFKTFRKSYSAEIIWGNFCVEVLFKLNCRKKKIQTHKLTEKYYLPSMFS